jgi:hypothetical protein
MKYKLKLGRFRTWQDEAIPTTADAVGALWGAILKSAQYFVLANVAVAHQQELEQIIVALGAAGAGAGSAFALSFPCTTRAQPS